MYFAAASSLALRRAQALVPEQIAVHRPGHGERAAAEVSAAGLAADLRTQATEIAERFDRRNGTDRVGTLIRGVLDAQPWVEHLPMSPTAVRRATVVTPPSTVDSVVSEPIVIEPVPATSGPDELLDLIEGHYEEDREVEGGAALDAFDERYGGAELTTGQRARLADLRAARLSATNEDRRSADHAAAIDLWREAAAGYAAAGQPEREQHALARTGAALCWSGDIDHGMPIVVAATDWLVTHAEPTVMVRAATRLAICYLNERRPDETLATLDRVASVVDEVPERARLRYSFIRLAAAAHLDRFEEVLRDAPAVAERLESLGMAARASRTRITLAGALEQTGQLAAAADQLAAAIPALSDPRGRDQLRVARAAMLARTERAAEAVDDLVDAVADRTAHGDEAGAADVRYPLALAYLNSNRPLDAAEVAEEQLAYRSRTGDPAQALNVRLLLARIYRRLNVAADAVAQLDAVADWYAANGERAGVGQMAQQAAEILDEANRDDDAAARFLVAADICAELDLPLPELYNRRRHATSLHWAHQSERAVAALEAADAVVPRVDHDDADARWEVARLHYDASRILWGAGELAEAAVRAGRAADDFASLDAPAAVADSRLQQAKIRWNLDEYGPAEAAARQGLAALPTGHPPQALVEVLDAALRRQDRDEEADAVWRTYGLSRPSTEDGER